MNRMTGRSFLARAVAVAALAVSWTVLPGPYLPNVGAQDHPANVSRAAARWMGPHRSKGLIFLLPLTHVSRGGPTWVP